MPTTAERRPADSIDVGPLDVRVLGPLRVAVGGEELRLGGPKPQTLFCVLVAAAGRAVSTDALVEALWANEPPVTAKGTLQSHVSRLRGPLGDHIVWESGSYRLDAPRGSVDAWRFEDEATAARALIPTDPSDAARRLRHALALWRGHPFAGLGECEPLDAEARRLDELRLRAVEDRIDADLALGRHSDLVGELDVLTVEHPLRERLHAQQMLALYRSGRQAEALAVHERLRRTLADELGIDPSVELRRLHQQVLSQDPALAPPQAVLEGGRLAFLFTDIEDSTPLWESDPAAMAAAVAEQDRIVSWTVETAGGRVVARTGDAIDAVFEGVDAAVRAAVDAQRALAAFDWDEATPLRVRMAIDVGEVELRDGRYYGPVLNRLGRMLGAGHGGQVLLSEDAVDELSVTEGIDVRSLGEYRFKGLGRPQPVAQLVAAGLEQDLPPLRLDRTPVDRSGPVDSVRGYELREELGTGDFGLVYRAYQASVGREVAVKVIRPEYANQAAFIRRFEAEARFIARLEHPHVVGLFDFWRDPGGAYLVMPLLRGGSLADALRRGPWNVGPALRLLDQVGSALSYAHRQGIVHRDVKPGNVLLDEDGNAYLSDFGIASRLADEAGGLATTSLAYVPPEELRGEKLGPRSDLFSFGVLTFELLTGVHPTGRDLPSLSEVRSDLPSELGDVLRRVTDDSPEERHERVEDYLRALRQALGADVVVPQAEALPAAVTRIRNPYKGLRAFQETDAADFYGRESLVDELLQAVSDHRLVAVVGASGSGKSSVVRAGLLPSLRTGRLPGSRGWLIADMFPGSYPLEELESALLRVAVQDPGGLVDELRSDERGLLRVTKSVLPRDDSELVLVIDQFEELFSLVDDEDVRRHFLDSLRALVQDERSRVRVLLTLRADFLDRPLEYPGFGQLVKAALVPVTPPTEESLGVAISHPARSVGVELEPGLIGEIVTDVQGQPGGLPLLQYALTELFTRRDDGRLTIAAYRESGGVAGALGRRAEELYQGLSLDGREVAHQLFLRLVTIDEETDDTRRRVSQGELDGLDVDHDVLTDVLQQFASYRLLTFDRDATTRVPTVEVAHEALIREWDRLRSWIDEQRDALVLHRRLQAAVKEWIESDRDPSYLLRGGRLEQAERWAQEGGIVISREEDTYLTESRRVWDEEQAIRRRRRRAIVGGLAAALAVVAVLAIVALAQWRIAEEEARVANERRLAGAAMASLELDPERSILLALEAADLARSAGEPLLPETVGALQQATQTSRLDVRFEAGAFGLSVSPDGAIIATDALDPETGDPGPDVTLFEAETGELLRTLSGDGPAMGIAFSPTDQLVAVGYGYGPGREADAGPTTLVVWDAVTGDEVLLADGPPHVLLPGEIPIRRVAWSPDGDLLAAGTRTPEGEPLVTVWDLGSRSEVTTISPGPGGSDMAFLDEETMLIADGDRQLIAFYDIATGEEVDALETPEMDTSALAIAWATDQVVIGSQPMSRIQAWDLGSRELVWERSHPSAFVGDIDRHGATVAVGGNEGQVELLSMTDGSDVLTLAGHTGAAWASQFDPAGEQVISVGGLGETRVWDVTATGPADLGAIDVGPAVPFSLTFSPDGGELAVPGQPGEFRVVDLDDASVLDSLDEPQISWLTPIVVSPDWRSVAWVDDQGEAWIRELKDVSAPSRLPPCTSPKAFSLDGDALALDGIFINSHGLCDEGEEGADLRSRVIDPASGDELLDLGERVLFGPGGGFNPPGAFAGGRYLAFTNPETLEIELHDLGTGERVAAFGFEGSFSFPPAFDPTGALLAGGTDSGRAWVLDVREVVAGAPPEEAMLLDFVAHNGNVPFVALDADGRLATSTFGGPLILWDIHTGEPLVEVAVDMEHVPFAAFSPGGEYLLHADSGIDGHVLRRFPLEPDRLIELAQSRVTRDLTEDECRRHLDPEDC